MDISARPMDEWTFECQMDISVRLLDEWTFECQMDISVRICLIAKEAAECWP